jgi:tetratricopeptide (TPR) repeat protein
MGHLYGELAAAYGNRAEYVSRAIDFYKAAIKADPSATMLNDELAGLYFQAGRANEAITELQDRLKKDPKSLDTRRLLGRIYLVQIGRQDRNRGVSEENVKLAIEQYRLIVEQDPKDIDSWLLLGRLYKVAQNSLESEKSFQKVLELEPGNEEAMTGLAMVYSGLGDNQRALGILKQVADRNPSLRSLTALVDAYETIHDYTAAAEVLRRAFELDPSNLDLKRNLAQDLMLAGKPEESLKVYAELAQEDPKDPEPFLRMSQVYREMNDFAKARAALDRAKQLEPDNFEIRYSEVSLLEAEGRHTDAISAMKQLVDSTESRTYGPPERANRMGLLERLGDLYRSNEQYGLAVDTFKKMQNLDPDAGPRASGQIVNTYRAAKDYTRALAEAEAAFKKYADDRGVGLTRAALLAELGKGEQAFAEVKRIYAGDSGKDSGFALA